MGDSDEEQGYSEQGRAELDEMFLQTMQLHSQGNYRDAISLAREAVEFAKMHLGEDHPDTAAGLNALGSMLLATGDYAGARPHLEEALEISLRALGEDHPHTATQLTALAILLSNGGDYAGARAYYEQALAVRLRVLGEDHLDTATSFNNLGTLLQDTGDYAGARPCLEQALEVRLRALSEDHPDTAASLTALGNFLRTTNDYAGARPYLERALEISLQVLGEDHPDTANGLANLGALLQATGDYAGARPYLEQALEINLRVLGENHPDTARNFNSLAVLLWHAGDHAAARPYLESALEISRRVLGEDHPHTATQLNSLGLLLQATGDYAGARPYLEQALVVHLRVLGEDHPDTVRSLNSLGALLQVTGDYAGARLHLERALEIGLRVLGEDHPDTARSLNSLGVLCWTTGDYAGTRSHLERALEITLRVLGETHPDTARSLHNLGSLLCVAGDYGEARPYLERALELSLRVLGEDHPDTANCLNSLGLLLRDTGDYAGARPYYEQALEIIRRVLGGDHPDTANCLYNLASLAIASDRASDGWVIYQEAMGIDDRMIAQVFSGGSERQRSTFLTTLRGRLDRFLSFVLRHLDSPPRRRTALDAVLRRKGLGAEALAAQRDAVLGGRYPHLRDGLTQLSTLREQIAQRALAGPGPEGINAHHQTLAEWTAQKDRLEAELVRRVPEMNLEQNLRSADRRAIALALDAGVALVEFVRFDEFDFHAVPARGERQLKPARYLAFVLPGGDPDAIEMIDLGEAEPIDRLIVEFRSSVSVAPDDRQNRNMVRRSQPTNAGDGTALRAAVFDPLRSALGDRTRLLISPDGHLSRLPLASLPANCGSRLADDYRISYVGTGRDVLRFAATASARADAPLVLCDPDFDLGSGSSPATSAPAGRTSRDLRSGLGGVRRLPGTLAEGRAVGELLRSDPWHGETALKKPFLAARRSPHILHLATHGFFLEDQHSDLDRELWGRMLGNDGELRADVSENPLLRSGLVLAGANAFLRGIPLPEDTDNGLLTALDVTGMDLIGTELVVLSACETGLGDVQVGEGVMGLQRAFTVAGARTLVMSLWSVDDEATRELMISFYRRLLAGEGKADALRHAQEELRARPEFADPYYWAAFVCQGDPGPLSAGGPRTAAHPSAERADSECRN